MTPRAANPCPPGSGVWTAYVPAVRLGTMKARHVIAVVLAAAAGVWVAIAAAQGGLGGNYGTGTSGYCGYTAGDTHLCRPPHHPKGFGGRPGASGGPGGHRTPTGHRRGGHHRQSGSPTSSTRRGGICPRRSANELGLPLRLPGNAIVPAVRAALRYSQGQAGGSAQRVRRGVRAYRARFAIRNGASGLHNPVARACGSRLARRTVIVDLYFPHAAPSSPSHLEVWVSKFARHTYRVWHVVR
jgi:hypothetical protein